jgi:hypothetical protein
LKKSKGSNRYEEFEKTKYAPNRIESPDQKNMVDMIDQMNEKRINRVNHSNSR